MKKPIIVEKLPIMSVKEKLFFWLISLAGVGAIVNYAVWWFQASHIAANTHGIFSSNFILFALLSFVIWHGLIQRLAIWFIVGSMRKPKYIKPAKNKKVALLTCFVPGSEPYEMLEKTIQAMINVTYPHDTWVLDEGNDEYVKYLCKKYGAFHFSRKGIAKYNQESGPYKAKTKAGNHNAWRNEHEAKYDFVAQMDMDHIPHTDYLDRILGYFKDKKVSFVVGPQIYANQKNWIARGAAEQAHIFHGPIQQGFFKYDMPLFIGTNHAYRPKAIKQVGGYASTIVEDHLTGMRMYAKKWKGVYVPEIIADGEGPSNWTEYLNQQMRWSYGIFEILFKHTPFLLNKLTWPQKINFLAAQTYYLTGFASLIGILLTCVYLVFGLPAANFEIREWIIYAFPPFIISFFIQYWSQRFYLDPKTESGHHLRGMLLSLGALPIYALAFFYVIMGKKLQYLVTAKGEESEHVQVPIKTFAPHLAIVGTSFVSLIIGIVMKHTALQLEFWAVFNIVLFSIVFLSSRNTMFASILRLIAVAPRMAYATAVVVFIGVVMLFGTMLTFNQNTAKGNVAYAEHRILTESDTVYLGLTGDKALESTDAVEKTTGKHIGIIGKYQSWGSNDNRFDSQWAEEINRKNSIPMISWEPWDSNVTGEKALQSKYTLAHIINGSSDSYIIAYAQDIKAWKKPVLIRFAHEMNGNWYPWSPINSNTPEEYKKAWIHVHDIFAKVGATNVTWVWSPNEPFDDPNNPYATNLDAFYPGDRYVDWVGISGFNWGTSGEDTQWRSFDNIVKPAYDLLKDYNKPIMISEINSSNQGGDKDQWVEQINTAIKAYPKLKAIVWYSSSHSDLFKYDFPTNAFGPSF